MAQPPDESKSRTLLDPELNPILNPLLAAHMGRWAEVYFTSPPEKREQAVAELVKELSQHSGSVEVVAHAGKAPRVEHPNVGDQDPPSKDDRSSPPLVEAIENFIIVCVACGHLNVGQRFCGMCGRPLANASQIPIDKPQVPELRSELGATNSNKQEPSHRDANEAESNGGPSLRGESMYIVDQYPDDNQSLDQSILAADIQYADRPSLTGEDGEGSQTFETPQPSFESFPADEADTSVAADLDLDTEKRPSEGRVENAMNRTHFSLPGYEAESDYESESRPQPYRLYIGAIVAIVLALLVYVTWRGNSGSEGNTVVPELPRATSEAAPPVRTDTRTNAAKASQATPAQSETGQPVPPQPPAHSILQQPTSTPRTGTTTADRNRKSKVHLPKPGSNLTPSLPSPGATNQGGAEELAIAEKYLKTGPDGAQQAVGWLWKAVAKENATATLVLSDLYLRGDGVPKNCDQARLLLDAAARKGESAAAERLRNLHSYGCQ